MSWRIQQIENNRSQRVLPSETGAVGATVVRSSTKGIVEPQYFRTGESERIISLFGLPSSSNPELIEALEYNKTYPIWLVSPTTTNSTFGGVIIKSGGLESIGDAVTGIVSVPTDMGTVTLKRILGTGDGSTTTFTLTGDDTLTNISHYKNTSIVIPDNAGGVIANLSVTHGSDIDTITGTGLGTSTLNTSTGALSIVYSSAPASGVVLYITYELSLTANDVYGLLVSKGVGTNYLAISDVSKDSSDVFSLNLKITNKRGVLTNTTSTPIQFGFKLNQEDGFGQNLYFTNRFKNSPYVYALCNDRSSETTLTFTALSTPSTSTILTGGVLGGTITGSEISLAYQKYRNSRLYDIAVFFDATALTGIPAEFQTLRTSYFPYSKFILPMANADVTSTLGTTLSATNRGIFYYYGWFTMINPYATTGDVIGTPTGEVAKNIATIGIRGFGGIAPAWLNENGMGGQLTSGRFLEERHNLDQTQLKSLDEARINPIIIHHVYGPMIVSRRTSIAGLSDDSFIDGSGVKDYIFKNIIEQVLPYQIVKLNDASHRSIITNLAFNILQPLTIAPRNVIREFAIKCDDENNTDDVLAREEFRLDIAIKLTPKSRRIVLSFINTPQGESVSEQFEI